MVAVLKTAVGKLTGGSNPSLSVDFGKVREWFESPPFRNETIAQLDRASVCGTEGRRFESSWSRKDGKMSEWSKETDSKSVVAFLVTEGSNPSLSEE